MAKATSFPLYNADKLIAAQQRNIDALASAGQIVVDGVKTIAQRQGEMMQSSVEQMLTAGQEVLSLKADLQPADQIAKAKAGYETAVNNTKELTEIAMKAQHEAVAVLTKCVMANIDEMKSIAKSA